jgi:hypothetical protein
MSNGALVFTVWADPVADDRWMPATNVHALLDWCSTVGPTAIVLYGRVVTLFDIYGPEISVDADQLAGWLGVAPATLTKALQRLVMFGLAHTTTKGYAVRSLLPPLADRHRNRRTTVLVEVPVVAP